MVTPGSKQARGFAVQICIVLKGALDLELGESKEFPLLKILTVKTVGKYISINKNIVVEDVEDEPMMEKQAEKKKIVSKKRPDPTVESSVVKRKRTSGRTTPVSTDLTLVVVAQEAVPIQMISAVTPLAPKRKAPKRSLQLPAGSDDEIVEKEPDMVDVGEKQREKSTVDDVVKLIEIVLTETEQMETDMGESDMVTERTDMDTETVLASIEHSSDVNDEDDNLDGAENEIARKMPYFTAPKQFLKEPLRSGEDDDISGVEQPSKTTDEELMSIEDLLKQIPDDAMLPSVTAEGPPRIQFGLGIQILGIQPVSVTTDLSVQTAPVLGSMDQVIKMETDSGPADPAIQLTANQNPDIPGSGILSQRHPDTVFNSPRMSTSSDSHLRFTADDIPQGDNQILLPAPNLIESFAELRRSINHMKFEQIRQKDDGEHLKDIILMEIRSLKKKLTEMLE
ncbi:splicing factor 3B subunit 1-like [Dorcoceras hygrometricum]|uniref:Splicing factor 3B subunit 1-like n=1 Tax=Dorcoceras hygrometricum TaxID=472368 RepID=A0A2Z7AMK5_9LAMI|nr:splicing factor 3B subunit 1-like [Dorcoceras hygrometricum]